MTHVDLPKSAEKFPEWIQDRMVERIAIMREANRVPDNAPTPQKIINVALQEAYQNLYV